MQAVTIHEGGELRFGEEPDPVARPGEVVVELRRAALNRRDLMVRSGALPVAYPFVPGSDGAGVRRDTGEEVVILPSLRWGEREDAPGPGFEILGGPTDGTFAELVVLPEANVLPRPRGLSWEEAAALPLAGLTAHRALFGRGGLVAGETVLVLGAGSGVSTFAVQLAAQAGARVLVTSSSQEKIDRAVAVGAERGVLYTDAGWVDEVRALTGGTGVDLVLDSVGSTWADSVRCVRGGGRVAVFGATGAAEATLGVRPVYITQVSILGTTMGSPRDFAALLASLERGTWRPVVEGCLPLADAEAALDRLAVAGHFGKLVLACS
ncbi:MAG: oxidoreductase [Thermoleophilia bacterium]|nr:oxidoreductase [Thermoleophilia bacterium]